MTNYQTWAYYKNITPYVNKGLNMTREDYNRALATTETWMEAYLMWLIGLPKYWTTLAVFSNLLAAAYIGYRLA